jgi:2-polyprenyl-6-methoxyphenol hydroxylase-like FAD-dependent oxidoreductase
MTAGLEDALALAWALAASPRDLPAALLAYQAERLPLVHNYQKRSRAVSNRVGRRRIPTAT